MKPPLQLCLLLTTLLTTNSYAARLAATNSSPSTTSISLQSSLSTLEEAGTARDISNNSNDEASSTATVSSDVPDIDSSGTATNYMADAALSSVTTFIQNDGSPTSSPVPLLNATDAMLSCRNYPSKAAVRACNAKVVASLFVLAYIFALRAVLWLQGLSVRQVLELGERLARCRDSFDGWAWEEQGSWKIRQQPNLPGVAMLGVLALQELLNERDVGANGDETDQKRRDASIDLDYRRQERDRRRDTTPARSQDHIAGAGNESHMTEKEKNAIRPMTLQEKAKITQMIKAAHERIMHDTRSKRVVWGVGVSLLVIGGSLVGLAVLISVPCKEISRLGTCPFREG
ncbi:hypothetical protein TWF696_001149 [Orbilia brochopaga]|uniref:Uncharacterized protein n=1 Tax=Orbilia brochopaga TaxID=3140254 RepID=A0AAV9VG69_9PEZI